MSKKLTRYIREIEKTEKKIEELKEYLSILRKKQKQDEDLEIVKSIRDIRMSSRELAEILDGIQNGSIAFQTVSPTEQEEVEQIQWESEEEDASAGNTGQIVKPVDGSPDNLEQEEMHLESLD